MKLMCYPLLIDSNVKNNLRLFQMQTYCAIATVQTSAKQGGTQQPPRRAALYTEGLSTAKPLPHTAQAVDQPHRLNLVNIHQIARPAHIR